MLTPRSRGRHWYAGLARPLLARLRPLPRALRPAGPWSRCPARCRPRRPAPPASPVPAMPGPA